MRITPLEAKLSVAGFLTVLILREEDLAGNSKHLRIGKTIQERGKEILRDDHVVVEQNNNIVTGSLHTPVVSLPEANVFLQDDDLKMGVFSPQPVDAVVVTAVVDNDDLVVLSLFQTPV